MKKNSRKYHYVCDNCGYDFYSTKIPGVYNFVECPRCHEEMTYPEVDTYNDSDSDEENIDIDYDE